MYIDVSRFFILDNSIKLKYMEVLHISNKDMLLNESIHAVDVRVVDSDGEQLGIMTSKDALAKAIAKDQDLVLIAPNAEPPVCRIMDYGKFKFEQMKKEKDARKNQKVTELKEVRLSVTIDIGDFNTKVNHAKRFINAGDKCKISLRFKGREIAHTELGKAMLSRFAESCSEFAVVEKPPKLEGRTMQMFLSAK